MLEQTDDFDHICKELWLEFNFADQYLSSPSFRLYSSINRGKIGLEYLKFDFIQLPAEWPTTHDIPTFSDNYLQSLQDLLDMINCIN